MSIQNVRLCELTGSIFESQTRPVLVGIECLSNTKSRNLTFSQITRGTVASGMARLYLFLLWLISKSENPETRSNTVADRHFSVFRALWSPLAECSFDFHPSEAQERLRLFSAGVRCLLIETGVNSEISRWFISAECRSNVDECLFWANWLEAIVTHPSLWVKTHLC